MGVRGMGKYGARTMSDNAMATCLLQDYAGLDVDSEHGLDTPKRFLDMLSELTRCRPYSGADAVSMNDGHIDNCIKWKMFESSSDGMVTQGPIPFVSVCNHHVLPFHGKAWVGYVPDGNVVGLSKLTRAVHHFARRLQVQEELTEDIADFLESRLAAKGVVVSIMAEHTCMGFRGVQVPGVLTETTVVKGVFQDHTRTAKAEFMAKIARMQ